MNLHKSAPGQTSRPEKHIYNPLSVMQQGEQIVCEVKRHPIGMLGTYVAAGGILIAMAVLAFLIVPNAADSSHRGHIMFLMAVAFVLLAALLLFFVFIANTVYWGNSWVVSSDSITQMSQTSLFKKQTSQLSLGNLEDVTSEKNGMLAQLFNFGVLKAETAGERSKFMFVYCPNPDYYAQKILAAREQFEQIHHGGKQQPAYAQQNSTFQQSQPFPSQVNSQPASQAQASSFQQPQPDFQSNGQVATAAPEPVFQPPAVAYSPPQPMPPSEDDVQAGYRPLYPDSPPSFHQPQSEPSPGNDQGTPGQPGQFS
jgi:hypothetical protein